MVNKGLCFTGFILHFFLVTSLLMWVALFRNCDLPYKKWILILDVVFIICCIIIGRVFLKLDIDKLFLKFEIDGINALNKVFFYIVLTAAPELTGATSIWQGGFSEIDNFNTELGGFLTDYYAVGKVSYLLNDEVYRYLIKLKIIKNSISHTCKNIDDAIYKFSNNEVWTRWDVPNRTLYYECNKRYQQLFSLSIALKKNVLPCPTGYKIEINIIEEST